MELYNIYGIYLSDHSVLTALETELVVFVTIMCTGLRGPSLWHLRGMGRLFGARGTDETTPVMRKVKDMLRDIKAAAVLVVEWCGSEFVRRSGVESKLGWVNFEEVVRDLVGWGDDEFPARQQRTTMSE